jgi:FkbM family methyltransferase
MSNFEVVDSIYGKWIVSRHAAYHYDSLVNTGIPVSPEVPAFLMSMIDTMPDGCVVLDIGSNAGVISVPIASQIRARGGLVYAFEVQKKLFQALCGTAVLNDLDNLTALNCGIGSEESKLKIPVIDYRESWDYGILSLVDQEKIAEQEYDTVNILPIDYFEFDRVDFIKMDIEGMELEALKGGRDTIEKYRPVMFIEYWSIDSSQLKFYFLDLNYTLYRWSAADVVCCPNEKKDQLNLNYPIF